jgi:hypothetical protein
LTPVFLVALITAGPDGVFDGYLKGIRMGNSAKGVFVGADGVDDGGKYGIRVGDGNHN